MVSKNGSGEVIFCVSYKPKEIIEQITEENNDFCIKGNTVSYDRQINK